MGGSPRVRLNPFLGPPLGPEMYGSGICVSAAGCALRYVNTGVVHVRKRYTMKGLPSGSVATARHSANAADTQARGLDVPYAHCRGLVFINRIVSLCSISVDIRRDSRVSVKKTAS